MDMRNAEGAVYLVVIGLVIAALQFLFAAVVAVALLVTVFLSVLSIIAMLNGGLTFAGDHITARDGKMFFVRGLIGMLVISILAGLIVDIMQEPIHLSPPWVWLAGFVLGSTGGEYVIYKMKEEEAQAASQQVILPPLPEEEHYLPPVLPPVHRPPFHYASWEDEEVGR